MSFFRLIRLPNLVIMFFTQVFSYFFLSPNISIEQLFESRYLFLCLASILVAAGGYIINDYLDVKLDLINKPTKVIVGQYISRRLAMFSHFTLNAIAIVLGLLIGLKVTIAIIIAAVLLWLYSVSLKQKFLVGNILVALLSAFVISLNYIYDVSLTIEMIIAYSVFAFIATLIREIIKDTEDMRGDGKFNCKTVPIVLGVRKTKSILLFITILFAATLSVYTIYYGTHFIFANSLTHVAFIIYMYIGIIIPLLFLSYFLKKADTTSDFSKLSLFTKVIMILGMLSMVFWRL